MPKYMVQASYVGEGLKGLLKEGGTKRRETVAQVIERMGGKLELFYYAFYFISFCKLSVRSCVFS